MPIPESKKEVVIIGAGPAGLTAALELVRRSDIRPIIVESSHEIGGISRTVVHNGYRMDIGGHRFFSKSDWVMNWWQSILPVTDEGGVADGNKVMLIRNRLSRIYFLRKYFDYPIKLSLKTLSNLGPWRVTKIGYSYALAMMFPRKPERSLEDFLINRFGRELYLTFFKDYTEKVWGAPCHTISAEWGAQRIKGLSILKAVRHALTKALQRDSIAQKDTNTSLIEKFMYPKLGPGQLWEEVARQITAAGGTILFGHQAKAIRLLDGDVSEVVVRNTASGTEHSLKADSVISTMAVRDLIAGIDPPPPSNVCEIARNLPYRDFITVGMLLKKMKRNPQSESSQQNQLPPDNWIYIQESDVRIGRLQVFNNWSPYLVADSHKVWLGLEYFCQEDDDLWTLTDAEMKRLATDELERIGMIDPIDVEDAHVVRVPKTYPAYFGTYARFGEIRAFVDAIPNLFLVGRNGMHRYNNQDHSMLTAKLAADRIMENRTDKDEIWNVNIDDEYHEEKPAS